MENYTENELVIDLSTMKSTAQLAAELSSMIEKSDMTGKSICLKLGNLDLKQSQLLSIKALIETTDASIQSVATQSDMTEASAVSLGITLENDKEVELPHFNDSISTQIGDLNDTFGTKTESVSETPKETVNKIIEEPIEEKQTEELTTEDTNESDTIGNPDITEKLHISNKILENTKVQSVIGKVLGLQDKPEEKDAETEETTTSDNTPTEAVDSTTNIDLVEPQTADETYEETETKEKSSEEKYVLLDTEGITPDDAEETCDSTAELPTLYLTQTLRSGQTVSYEGNIFIIGDTHPGSEVIASGDVTVWGILGGLVHAGSKGNQAARVRALKLNPIQLRIAGLYSRRNDTVNIPFVQKTDEFTPEEARINNKQIVVYKTLRREN